MKSILVFFVLLGCTLAVVKIPLRKVTSMREKMHRDGTWKDFVEKRRIAREQNRGMDRQTTTIPQKSFSDVRNFISSGALNLKGSTLLFYIGLL